jgi:hypothetical protein
LAVSSLTLIVSGSEVQWYFGPGAWKYRVARADIAGVSIVRNRMLSGFGVRKRSGFAFIMSPGSTPSNCI